MATLLNFQYSFGSTLNLPGLSIGEVKGQ